MRPKDFTDKGEYMKPTTLAKDVWYYVGKRGIEIIIDKRSEHLLISWERVRRAIKLDAYGRALVKRRVLAEKGAKK